MAHQSNHRPIYISQLLYAIADQDVK